MQTFLPYPSYVKSAQVLDNNRLLNQATYECPTIMEQILHAPYGKIIRGKMHRGWSSHPAVKMWIGHEGALAEYSLAMLEECMNRGEYHQAWVLYFNNIYDRVSVEQRADPPWLGSHILHESHRANLLRKDPYFYGKWGWSEQPGEKYYWPV